MSKTVRIAMIGCGGNGRRQHLKKLTAHEEVQIVALVDTSEAMIAAARKDFPLLADVPAFDDYRRMLESVGPDAAAISTPHTLHFRQVMDSLDAGCHVLCEKPLTTSVAETKEVAARARRAGKAVVVAFQRRWQGMQRFMRSFVRDEAFGTPVYVQSFVSQGWLALTKGAWRQQKALSGGGQINDTGAHIIDMVFWMMPSRPVEVVAMIDNRGTEVDIDSSVAYRFENGCVGSLAILGSGPRRVFWEDMTVCGSAGRALFFRQDALKVATEEGLADKKDFEPDGSPDAHFIDVIAGRASNESPPEEFLPLIAFTEACWRSAAEGGKPMKVEY